MLSPAMHPDSLALAGQASPISIRGLFRAEAASIARSTSPCEEFRRLRGIIARAHEGAAAALAAGGAVEDYEQARARLADGVLAGVLHIARCKVFEHSHGSALPLAAIAIGGYGRRQLAPASDLDVLFVLPNRNGDRSCAEMMLTFAIPAIWDLGLRLDHFLMSEAECRELLNRDLKMRSSYLDARLVWGCPALHNSFLETQKSLPQAEKAAIVSQLLAESGRRDDAGPAHSASEPNLKSGPGALRDIQCLRWLTQLRRGRPICGPATLTQISAAAKCLSRIRCFLHLQTVRPQDRLTRDLQAQVARRLGFNFADDETGESEILALVRHHTGIVRKTLRLCQQTEFLAANCA